MNTHDFEGSNFHFGPPPGMEDRVGWLHVFHNGTHAVSAWKPTPEELAKLNAGESVFISVMSGVRSHPNKPGVMIPVVHPVFVGDEATTAAVVSNDGGKVWR